MYRDVSGTSSYDFHFEIMGTKHSEQSLSDEMA